MEYRQFATRTRYRWTRFSNNSTAVAQALDPAQFHRSHAVVVNLSTAHAVANKRERPAYRMVRRTLCKIPRSDCLDAIMMSRISGVRWNAERSEADGNCRATECLVSDSRCVIAMLQNSFMV